MARPLHLAVCAALLPAAALAQAVTPDPAPGHPPPVTAPALVVQAPRPVAPVTPVSTGITVDAGSGRVLGLAGAAASVFAADPKVAEVRPASATSLFVFGVSPGRTTVAALDAAGKPIAQYEVTVRPSAYGASEAQATLARILPGRDLRVDTRPGGLVLSGEVATAAEAEQAAAVAQGFLPATQTLDNRITVLGSTQVNLRVRIIEVDRTVTRQLGVDWTALGTIGRVGIAGLTNNSLADPTNMPSQLIAGWNAGSINVNAIIDALAADQLVTILAEPNLTAQSGETASFLAGGEYPIPVAQQNNQVTVEFKQYGVSLAFVPTVLSGGHISLHVRPEVSELSTQGAIQISAGNSSLSIPALTVRRADTTVELGSGQSFAIAGLLQSGRTDLGRAIPGIGEIPVLGALARSDKFQRNETELVIVVTPYLVRPAGDPSALRGPAGATLPTANDVDRILFFRQFARGAEMPARIPGDVGFVVR